MSRIARSFPLLALFIVIVAIPTITSGAPGYGRLSYTGDPSTTMTITWHTLANAGTEIRYGTSSGNYTETADGTSFVATVSEFGHIHEVTLTGLLPDTEYFYIAGDDLDGFSSEFSFKTAIEPHELCGEFSFVFLGDNRPDPIFGAGENWDEILNQAVGHDPAFLLNGGDLVTDGENIGGWIDLLAWTTDIATGIPFMPCIGNHDTGPGEGDLANYNQLFSLPRSLGTFGSGTEDYYFFTYGNAIFVSLSTEGFDGGDIPFADQAAWLDEVLTDNPRKWKIIYYHKPSYTHQAFFAISHEPNENGQNEALIPIIDEHHVDIVINSHNHWYERFHPTACSEFGDPGSALACTVGDDNFAEGTVFIVSGGAGAFTLPEDLCGTEPGRAECNGDHHYLSVTIENEILTLETWGAFPQSNEVIDSITIVKDEVDCSSPDGDADVDGGDDAGEMDTDTEEVTETETTGSVGGCGCHAVGRSPSMPVLSEMLFALIMPL